MNSIERIRCDGRKDDRHFNPSRPARDRCRICPRSDRLARAPSEVKHAAPRRRRWDLYLKTRKRWWWWTALVGAVGHILVVALTYWWALGWMSARARCLVQVQNGVAVVWSLGRSRRAPTIRPWYGELRYTRTGGTGDWIRAPRIISDPAGRWRVVFPLHLPLLALLAVVGWPYLPSIVKRRRRKAGLCVACAYDLTGNESDVCPECGEAT